MDYTNLPAEVQIDANQTFAQVFVQPLFDTLLEFDEPVTLTLLLTNGYIVDPTNASLTVFIKDSQTTDVVETVLTNLVDPVGIDYHAPSNFILLSVNHPGGAPNNFARVNTNGGDVVVTNWSGIAGVEDEVKLATVKQTLNGFSNGDMFFGSDTNVGWLSVDGTASNLNWCVLTNDVVTNASHLRGSLYVDQSGTFSNNLIAITSGEDYSLIPRGVWMVNAQAQPRLLANILATHLEGAITITNDSAKWGPWAGRILTGDEQLGVIFSVDTNGMAEAFSSLGIDPEDFDIIPPDQDLYCVNIGEGSLLKISRNVLTNHVGSLLITQAGEYHNQPPGLFIVSWNSTNSFEARRISLPDGMGGTFEHVTFAPVNLPVLAP